jgi:hypothetical protein
MKLSNKIVSSFEMNGATRYENKRKIIWESDRRLSLVCVNDDCDGVQRYLDVFVVGLLQLDDQGRGMG